MWLFLTQLRSYGSWLLIAILLTTSLIMHYRLALAQDRYAQAAAKLASLDQEVQQQNAAIQQWQATSQKQQQQLRQAEARIVEQRLAYTQQVQKIMQTRVPANCQDAVSWANEEAKHLNQRW